jgi:hypothetical protein
VLAQGRQARVDRAQDEETIRITLSGEIELDYVWRRQEIVAFTGGGERRQRPRVRGIREHVRGVRRPPDNIDLSDNVSAMFEVGTKRVDAGSINFFAAPRPRPAAARAARPDDPAPRASILIKELYWTELSLKSGIMDWGFDVRGRGSSTAFDLRHSQQFIHAPQPRGRHRRHARRPRNRQGRNWSRWASGSGTPDPLHPRTWSPCRRSSEGGSVHNDESLYAIDLFYKFDSKESRFGLIFAVTNDPGDRQHDLYVRRRARPGRRLLTTWTSYAEFYFQNGIQQRPGGRPRRSRSAATAFNAGPSTSSTPTSSPGSSFTFTYFSGDGDCDQNGKASAFNSYENIRDLLILEDMYTGFDWDTNYRALKLNGRRAAPHAAEERPQAPGDRRLLHLGRGRCGSPPEPRTSWGPRSTSPPTGS